MCVLPATMAAMLVSNVTMPRVVTRAPLPKRTRVVAAKASTQSTTPKPAEIEISSPTLAKAKSLAKSVLTGVVATGVATAFLPDPAFAVSLRDPVFGDIQVWQFIVLTAGYWWGIEYYLENKYDEPEGGGKKNPAKAMPKVSQEKKNAFTEANAKASESSESSE